MIRLIPGFTYHRKDGIESYGRSSDEQTAHERGLKIYDELAELGDHPWAGIYSTGGFPVNKTLYLAPESGFMYTMTTCVGLSEVNYGSATCEDGRLKLSLTLPSHNTWEELNLASEFFLVPWGEQLYLVPPEKMMKFCEGFNSGSYPSFFFSKVKWGLGRYTKLAGLPEVPEEYKKYLLKEPLDAEILSVGEPKQNNFPVTLNWGSRHGLYSGMKLHVTLSADSETRFLWNSLEITAVSETRANGIFQLREDSQRIEPKPGWRLSAPRRWLEDDEVEESEPEAH